MEQSLFCTSLRRRPDWVGLPRLFLQTDGLCGRWKETELGTHDVAIPLPSRRVFRTVFISPRDATTAPSLNRIERLYNLNGGQDAGIIFLLECNEAQQSAVSELMALQLQLVGNWELPIIPVKSVPAIPAALSSLQRQLQSAPTNRETPSPVTTLLPFCSNREPLAEHTVNILTDTTSGFRDLLSQLSSPVMFESGIASLLGGDADKLRSFWRNNYSVD